jgi:type I restriction enzyme S subunit
MSGKENDKKDTEDWVPTAQPIPDRWSYVEFEDAFDVISTSALKIQQKDYLEAGIYPIIDQGQSLIGGFTDSNAGVIDEDRALIIFGDHTKCFKFAPFPFVPGADGTKVLKPRAYLDEKFSYYACLSLRLPDRGYSRHYSFLKRSQFPVAPKNEPCRIVEKIEKLFSELDEGVESLKIARDQLKVYRQAVFKHAFEGKLTALWREEHKDKLESTDQLLARIKKERDARHKQELKEWKAAVDRWQNNGKPGGKPKKPSSFKPPMPISAEEGDLLPTLPNGWQYARLSEIAQIGSGMSVSGSRAVQDPIDVAYLRVANVQRGFLDLSEIKYMKIERSQLPDLRLKQWDVLFNEGGDRDKLGRGWVWQSELSPCITQNHVFRASLYVASEYNAKIISYWGNTFGQRYFEKTGKQTTNLASINRTVLSEFPMPLLTAEEQKELCDQIDRIMSIIEAQEGDISEALKRAALCQQSILRRAFSGRLVAQDPNDEPASVLLKRIKAGRAEQDKDNKNNKRRDAA